MNKIMQLEPAIDIFLSLSCYYHLVTYFPQMPPSVSDINAVSGKTFDYIICGGGTSGCVIAAELSSIPNVSVLLIEAGRDSGLSPDVLVPGKYVKQLQEDKEGLWELETVPQTQLNGRKLVFLRGKQLGGSS